MCVICTHVALRPTFNCNVLTFKTWKYWRDFMIHVYDIDCLSCCGIKSFCYLLQVFVTGKLEQDEFLRQVSILL